MFEELFLESEDFGRTVHGKVLVARNGQKSAVPLRGMDRLTAAAKEGDTKLALRLLAEAVPSLRLVAGRRSQSAPPEVRFEVHEVSAVPFRRSRRDFSAVGLPSRHHASPSQWFLRRLDIRSTINCSREMNPLPVPRNDHSSLHFELAVALRGLSPI
jgi:hypothetical protein